MSPPDIQYVNLLYQAFEHQHQHQLVYKEEQAPEDNDDLILSPPKMAKFDTGSYSCNLFPASVHSLFACRPPLMQCRILTAAAADQGRLRKLGIRDYVERYRQKFLPQEELRDLEQGVGIIEDNSGDGMRLLRLLISCAEAVACRDRAQAGLLIRELKASTPVHGTAFQRVASCFVRGLSDRLALVQPLGAVGFKIPAAATMASDEKKEAALGLAYELCPYLRFGHFVANAAFLEAFEGERFVHVVDLGMTLSLAGGQQWVQLIDHFAFSAAPLKRVRITGVGANGKKLRDIGDALEHYARELGVNLEFFAVEAALESLDSGDLAVEEGEAIAVNSMLQLHCVVKESRGALNSVLQMIHELSPKVLVLVEQDSSHNGPFFLGRFMEALHYYSAVFDALDAARPKYDTKRAKVEQHYFAEEIKNIVSCEGPARVERHEKVDQWRRRMSRAGFQAAPAKMGAQAREWLAKNEECEGYTVAEEKGCIVLGWKSQPIIAASCWKC